MIDETAVIRFRNVSKSFSDNVVLKSVDAQIYKGELITLIGKSGCGKTTFLKLINALLMADSGSVEVFGDSVANIDHIELRRKIGYVIQSVGLFPHLTVRKNIEYVPNLFKHPPDTTFSTDKLLEMVSLGKDLLDRFPQELSGGQKQRVGIARALAIMPSIILMDEPFTAVDEITRKQLQESISEIHGELGVTIVFVTHSVDEAFRLGSRVAIFENHGMVQFSSPEEILNNPADAFVRELTKSAIII